jgi:hypothetical protein
MGDSASKIEYWKLPLPCECGVWWSAKAYIGGRLSTTVLVIGQGFGEQPSGHYATFRGIRNGE